MLKLQMLNWQRIVRDFSQNTFIVLSILRIHFRKCEKLKLHIDEHIAHIFTIMSSERNIFGWYQFCTFTLKCPGTP